MGQAPEVLHLPAEELKDLNDTVGRRYLRTMLTYPPAALRYALANRTAPEVSDQRFAELMTEGLYSKHMCRIDPSGADTYPEPELLEAFAPYLPGDSHGPQRFFVHDYRHMGSITPTYKGMYTASCVLLSQKDARILDDGRARGVGRVLAIQINKLMLGPTDGPAWELAKYYVLQGGAYTTSFIAHPRVHTPYDALNAITKSAVPKNCLLFALLYPHLRYTLGLNNGVLESHRSVITDSKSSRLPPYSPFTARRSKGLSDLFVIAYDGASNNRCWPPFCHSTKPADYSSWYGKYLGMYFEPFLNFTRKVVAQMDKRDRAYVERWAYYICRWVPGFPDKDQIFEPDVLARSLARVMHSLSVEHSIDHHLFATDIGVKHFFFRLRIAPPTDRNMPPFDPEALSNTLDIFQARLAWKLFFKPFNLTNLIDINYAFPDNPQLKTAAHEFFDELRAVDKAIKEHPHMAGMLPVHEIAGGIQY